MPTASDHRKAEFEQQANNSFPAHFSARDHVCWKHDGNIMVNVICEKVCTPSSNLKNEKGKRKSMDSM